MKEKNTKFLWKIIIFIAVFMLVLVISNTTNKSFATEQEASPEFVYLSDISYSSAKVGWGKIHLNETDSGGEFSVRVEGGNYSFEKGIWAHASSEVVYDLTNYQDYDYLTTYMGVNTSSGNKGNGVKFYIYTSTDGKEWNLKTESDPQAVKSSNDAIFTKIDIRDAKFLKLVANDNGANGNDHAVYVDAKLIKETYKEPGEDLVPSLEQLDQKIKTDFENANLATNKEYELTLLKREFISKVGNFALRKFLSESEVNEETYRWLTSDVENLRLYMLGGTPDGGNYYNSLTQLARLYSEYEEDFSNTELLNNKWYPQMTYGDLYKKMAISLSLTHSQRVALWMQPSATENQSDAVKRYAIFKYLHKNGNLKASESLDMTLWFEALQVEEMRFIMNNLIDDEEILWLNAYVQTFLDKYPNQVGKYLTPHPYMAYVWPNYGNEIYYSEENRDYFNELFSVNGTGLFDLSYTIPGGKNTETYEISITRGTPEYKLYKVWMNIRNKFGTGAVCGGISKTGSNIRATHGIPATVIGQPGHAAILYYTKDANGKGYWGIDNDVSGWTASEKGERLLLDWGNANTNYARGSYQVVYMALAQEAINDYENLVKCEEEVMLAKVYTGDLTKQEEIYRKALEIQPINLDAWLGLINVYNANENKTEDEFYELAEELAENLKYFPLPMYHLTNLIKPKLTSVQNSYKFTLLQTRILTEGSQTPNNSEDNYYVYQPSLTRLEANFLLGKIDKTIASFSFDGTDAGKIVLSSRFDGNGIRWDYSLDGKQTWNEVSFTADEEHKLQLTQEQIKKITAENDIYVHIVGVNYDENNLYKIDITKGTIPANIYANDLENRVVGVNLGCEWRYTENDNWISYSVVSPDLTGNKTVQIRQSATGTKLTSDPSPIYTFTEDNQPDTRKYIPVSHLTIHGVSTEAVNNGGAASNAIDANYNTRWHSAWNGSDTERYIIIKLDRAVSLSAVEFVPAGGGNGKIYDGTIYGSMDGEDWEELANLKNVTYTNQANTNEDAIKNTKSFEIENPKEVQYVKIVADRTNGNWFTAREFNFYQDLTKNPHPTAGIAYSTTESTNGIVVARLINPSTEITITNNDGKDTYIFTENGEFTFEFEDKNGVKGSAVAKVNWIDKDAPTADVKYKLDADKRLLVLLDNISEDVYLLDENNNKINYVEVENGKLQSVTYLDDSGNTYKTIYVDENGHTKKIAYKNTTGQVTNVAEYVITLKTIEDENEETNVGEIEKEEYFDSEGNNITISDSEKESLRSLQQTTRSNPLEYALEESGEYEFRLLDKANNIAYKSIKVDYINNDTTILASDITYDITKLTNKDVIATIKPYIIDTNGNKDVNVTITSDNGKETHTFTKNGEFTFKYKDASDEDDLEVKEHKAKVSWIDKVAPKAQIKYSTTQSTNKAVIATLVNESEEIIITNNGTSRQYTFTENGEFIFEFQDKAGNKGTATAKVDWIKKEQETPDEYLLGDVNKDGKITQTDLLLIKRHLVSDKRQEWILTGDKFNAGDMNKDGKITATDLILIKRLILKQMETHS